MTEIDTAFNWEVEIAALLDELSSVQDELLAVLSIKREQLVSGNMEAISATQAREELLATRLKRCQERRSDLLTAARKAGLAGDSLGKLATTATGENRAKLGDRAKAASVRMRLLRNETLTNWVLAQRALLHVSQLVEIIATGGRLQPTYGEGESVHARGSLVNHEA